MSVRELPLGMIPPTDDVHRQRYSLAEDYFPTEPQSGVVGSDWMTKFDRPYQDADGHHWIVKPGTTRGDYGSSRGGHAYCINGVGIPDPQALWRFYDQVGGSCVGYSWSRVVSHSNGGKFDALWLYHQAQAIDEWNDTPPNEGTSVRAGADVLRTEGHRRVKRGVALSQSLAEGISANRWARDVNDIARVLHPQSVGKLVLDRGYVIKRGSWGESYPHAVRIELDVLDWLIFEKGGEFAVMTDR